MSFFNTLPLVANYPCLNVKDFNAADWMIHDIGKILKGSYYIMGLKRAGKETLMQKKWDRLILGLFKRSRSTYTVKLFYKN